MGRDSTSDAASAPPLMAPELIWEKMFCPRQGRVEDVPVYFWRYTKGIGEYFRMLDALKWREIDLSPFLVAAAKGVKIPVTPLVNPVTEWSSYFIIRMIDDEDETYKVDCLIRDSDLYFMGFRRWMMLKGWSRWYRFKEPDMRLPAMFNAIELPVVAGYEGSGLVRPGGVKAMRIMFKAFSRYPEGTISTEVLQLACYCFMATVPESRRQRSVKYEVARRIAHDEQPSPLSEVLYDGMHSWDKQGAFVLQNLLDNRLLPHHRVPRVSWSYPTFDLVQVRDIIGEKGELTLINHKKSLMGIPVSEIKEKTEQACKGKNRYAHRKDPGFRQQFC